MKFFHAFVAALALAPALTTAAPAPAAPTSRPNILVIFADDLGWKDVGFNGTDFYETPNLDRLATQGTVFAHAYAAAGNCAPSRASLWSGQYSPRHGVYAVGRTDRGPKELQRGIAIPNTEDLPGEKITLAESLRDAGYRTGLFGKWHLGDNAPHRPADQGFDVYYDSRHPNPNRKRDEPEDPKGAYSLTRAALKFIEEKSDRPFFAFLSHHAIHSGLEARPSSLKKFEAKKPGAQHRHALYAACLYDLDDTVGLVMARLEELGLAQNTIVIFTSDNGGTQQSSQEPLRGNKGGYYEGGIRAPFIVRWPGSVAAGAVNATPIINVDLYPTFLAAAVASAPKDYPLDGENLLPLFTGQATSRQQAIFWHFPGYLDDPVTRGRDPVFRTRPVTVIRRGDWKLHLYHEEWAFDGGRQKLATNRAVELYNLAADPGERFDLAKNQTATRDELLDATLAWIDQIGARLVSQPNPGYNDDAKPAKKNSRKKRSSDES
jgi:arylsulfatase A-like enzyme